MRRIDKITIISLAISSPFLLMSIALAADQNTYRAGTPYLKTVANHHTQCESQCSGDAACRSWNFIRPNAGAASGICELNTRAATPVPSRFAMSGIVNTSAGLANNKIVLAGTNTIRVGTPSAPKPRIIPNQARRTIVKRQPVPTQKITQNANFTRPLAQRPQIPKQQQPQRLTPEQAYYRQQYLAYQRQQTARQQQNQRRQQPMQQQSVLQQPPRQVNAPRQMQEQPTRQPQQLMRPQPSLYGSLHDDLTQNMTAVPRPKTAPDTPANADSPLATSRAVPTKPVVTQPLKTPIPSELVGG